MIEKHLNSFSARHFAVCAVLVTAVASSPLWAQVQATQPRYPVPGAGINSPSSALQLPPLPITTPITANATVVEEVVARVNDQVITRTEFERAQQGLLQEAQQQGNVTPADLQDKSQNLLRDMIDQQLLLSKGKELGITGDAETIRQLDEIRKQNHLDSMEALEKAAAQQGISFEDFKQRIRNSVITQQVVRDEVGRRINMTRGEEQAYYDAHKEEFSAPEQVHLSEILVPTAENATNEQLTAAQSKADGLEGQLKGGANFAALAKGSSGGPTANAGGDLGDFKRGQLGDVLEKATFSLQAGGFTEPIRTRQGFVILRVDTHQAAGVPPLADVEPQVQQALYLNALQPALRAYLTKARDEAYLVVKAGYTDTGNNRATAQPLFTAYTPPAPKKKAVKHQAAEQKRAELAAQKLSDARAKVAEKAAAKAASDAAKQSGVKNTSKPQKPPKIRREKIRYGQAPRNALPPAPALQAESTPVTGAPLGGQAPGAALGSSQDSTTTISIGTGVDPENPLAQQQGPTRKTRFSARQSEHEEQRAQTELVKAEKKASARPVKATSQETADEKQQAAPLGLNGDTVKKKKAKRAKCEPKERLQDKEKPAEPAPVAPTVNPVLGTTPVAGQSGNTKPNADTTTIPPASTPAPGALPQGQPVPSATQAGPGAPTTTPTPH